MTFVCQNQQTYRSGRVAHLDRLQLAVYEVVAAQQGEEQVGVVVQPDAVVFVYIPADAHRLFLADVVNDAQHVERLTLILLVVRSDGVTFIVDNADRSTSFER